MGRIRGTVFLAGSLGLFAAAPLKAEWHEASSEHFVIYADDSENDIKEFAENLERFHSAMVFLTGRETETPSPSNRVTIFVVGGSGDIRRLSRGNRNVAGFYQPRAGASRAFVQDIKMKSGYPSFSTVVLLHEYAHHFLISSSRFAMPRWLSEGAAEFFSSSSFEKDGGMKTGRPAHHRASEISYDGAVPVEDLLSSTYSSDDGGSRSGSFYGTSWALFHMLWFSAERQGQLNRYWQAVAAGKGSLEAGREVFGDLDALDDDLQDYMRQRRMLYMPIAADKLPPTASVALRQLPEGEAKMMDVRMVSQRGVTREEALELVDKARKIAARYSDDAGVLVALAEAEHDAGNYQAAIEVATRAIALDPARPNAYVQKGYAQFALAAEGDEADKDLAYREAMGTFGALNRIENDHPLPLIYYYRSFLEQGREPNETARRALERAAELAPFDQALAMNAGLMLAGEGKIARAIDALTPLASDPHGGELPDTARRYIAQLEREEEGTVWIPRDTAKTVGNSVTAAEE